MNPTDENGYKLISFEDEQKLRAYFCACCRLIKHKLPDIALQAIQLGEDYNKGLVEAQELKAKREALWQYLSDEEQNFNAAGRHWLDRSCRAAMGCVIVGPINIHDAYEHLDWGPGFCNSIEDHRAEQSELARALIYDCDFVVAMKNE